MKIEMAHHNARKNGAVTTVTIENSWKLAYYGEEESLALYCSFPRIRLAGRKIFSARASFLKSIKIMAMAKLLRNLLPRQIHIQRRSSVETDGEAK